MPSRDLYRIKFHTITDGENHTIYYQKDRNEDWPDILTRIEKRFGKNQLRGIRKVIDIIEARNRRDAF